MKLFNKKGMLVLGFLTHLSLIGWMAAGTFISMGTAAYFTKDYHRVEKAENVCIITNMYPSISVPVLNEDGKVIKSVIDQVNKVNKSVLREAPDELVQFCKTRVSSMEKDEILAYIKD